MNWQELDETLHQVEEFEKRSYYGIQRFRRARGYDTADAEGRMRIHKMWEQILRQELDKNWYKEPVILSYTEGRKNQLVRPLQEEDRSMVLHSRKLVAEEQGIRKWMMIQKHPRFSVTFEHAHSFVEINYLYSGHLINYVNGRSYPMEKGDIMIMEPGCYHWIDVPEEDDILINFVLFPSALATLLDKVIPGESMLSRFLIAALERGYGKNNYVSLRTRDDKQIQTTVKEILCEYIDEGRTGSEAMVGYLTQEFFTRLWRFSEENRELTEYGYAPDNKAVQILSYIKEHAVDCTRESVAAHFGYSGSRISNLLTEQFGKSFVALRNEMRLEMIEEKLKTTDLPVQQIAEQYGIPNQTHFYRLYREYFGRLPRQST